jgi:hypothetical protein
MPWVQSHTSREEKRREEKRREEERKEKKKTHTLAHLVEVFVFFLR